MARIGLSDEANPPRSGFPADRSRGSAWVAAQIRRAILDHSIRPGEKLPAERQLAIDYGLARATVRLALMQLTKERLLIRKIGSGTYVTDQPVSGIGDIADSTSPLELIEARLALEPHMTHLAVLQATARDLERLGEACALAESAGSDAERFTEGDTQFHLRIAEATNNRLILWLYHQINDIRGHAQWRSMRDKVLTAERIDEYNRQHRELLAAIAARDAEGAVAIVTSHLRAARRQLLGTDSR